jgi:hypothetical protein
MGNEEKRRAEYIRTSCPIITRSLTYKPVVSEWGEKGTEEIFEVKMLMISLT